MKAAILDADNRVINIARVADEAFAVAQGWILSDAARIGDSYDAETGSFTPLAAPVVPLEDLRDATLERINTAYQAEMDAILSRYPWAETLTFERQEREARAWQTDNAAPTPYLDTMLTERAIDKATLVTNILAKADQYVQLSGAATGKRHRLEDEIEAAWQAGDRAALEGIGWA